MHSIERRIHNLQSSQLETRCDELLNEINNVMKGLNDKFQTIE